MRSRLFSFVIAVLLLTIFATTVQGAGPTGAIFTTTPNGGIVNENTHYDYKIEVYLDGGPGYHAPKQAAGLDDGLYVFQVTDPSGGVLLSMDPSKCRIVEVKDGVIEDLVSPADPKLLDGVTPNPLYGLGTTYIPGKNAKPVECHIQDAPEGAAGVSGHHDTNIDTEKDGLDIERGIVVQLMPFLDTPNPGGVYKAWVSKFDTYLARGGVLVNVPGVDTGTVKKKGVFQGYVPDPGFGPPRSDQKTDNFKVKEVPPYIKVVKYEDVNGNGVLDVPPDVIIEGWKVWIWEDIDFDGDFDTDDVVSSCLTPCWKAIAPGVKVKVVEDLPSGWVHSYLYVDGTAQVVNSQPTDAFVQFSYGDVMHKVAFGNYKPVEVKACKLEDVDGDPATVADRVPVANWPVALSKDGTIVEWQTTGADGCYSWSGLKPGPAYDVHEKLLEGWFNWTPLFFNFPASVSGGKYSYTFVNSRYVEVKACKVEDQDGLLSTTTDRTPVANWPVALTEGGVVVDEKLTGTDGCYTWTKLMPGKTYDVHEKLLPGWYNLTPVDYVFPKAKSGDTFAYTFANSRFVEVKACKLEDVDGDPVTDADRVSVAGWPVALSIDGVVKEWQKTGADGCYTWTGLKAGPAYDVHEKLLEGWFNWTPLYYNFPASVSGGKYSYTFINSRYVEILVHKFFDINADGIRQDGEPWLPDVEFCLYKGATADPMKLVDCELTNATGIVKWTGLKPGTYTVVETLKVGWFATKVFVYIGTVTLDGGSATSVTFTLLSGETAHVYFGNVTNCVGLTPGYWVNWRNHYTEAQFLTLLPGTIASTIGEADLFLTSTGCDEGNEVPCLRRFVLANQLTLNLTKMPWLPNPSGGNLYPVCQLIGCDGKLIEGNLGAWLEKALDMLAHPDLYTRAEILWVKDILDKFANMKYIYWP